MSRLILHIGTHKTASTALQQGFAARRAALAAAGLVYPHLDPSRPEETAHHGLVAEWNPALKAHALPGGSRAALRALAARHGGTEETVLVSSQEFSRGQAGAQVDFRTLREDLAGFDRIEVLCTLRAPWQMLQSLWCDLARHSQPPPPRRLVEAVEAGEQIAGLWWDHSALYAHLRQSFAAEEITLLDYRRLAWRPRGLPGAVLSHLGLDAETLLPRDLRLRVSPLPLAAWAACQAAGAETPDAGLLQAASSALRVQIGLRRPNTLWRREELERLERASSAAAARLDAALKRDGRPGFALSPAPLGPEAVHPEDLTEAFWLRMARRQFTMPQPLTQPAAQPIAQAGG